MSVNEKMTAIANAIREKTGKTNALTLDDMAAAIPTIYSIGFTAGEDSQKAVCFHATMTGNGTNKLSFNVPFEPEYFCITGFNPYPASKTYTELGTFIDLGTFYSVLGVNIYNSADSSNKPKISVARMTNTYRFLYTYENGVFTVSAGTISNTPIIWETKTYYNICAAKSGLTQKERLTREITTLPSDESGTVTFVKTRVNAAVTTEEWASLIATKPSWTFKLA